MPESGPHDCAEQRPAESGTPEFLQEQSNATRPAGAASVSNAAVDAELARLRNLLINPEMKLLEDIQRRLDDSTSRARDVSTVIAEALALRAGKDDMVSKALEPVIENNFKTFLQKRPHEVTSALFPIIGSTIRRSIAESFRSMMEGFSKSLELSFSLRGLRWRFEALRAGKPFSEIVLLHTLLYRVEQVFFVHAETGLVLAHVVAEGVESQDADMVSGMLTAIQDFARDSFSSNREGDLESLRLGDFTVFLERGPQAYLACVVRGTPPADFQQRMRASLEIMSVETADFLHEFSGDNAPFQIVHRHMDDLLIAKSVDEGKPIPFKAKLITALIFLALLGGLGAYFLSGWREDKVLIAHHQALEEGVEAIHQEPGYAILEVERDPAYGIWRIFCLKDGLARPPEAVLTKAGRSPSDYEIIITPYLSYQPELVERRIKEKINPLPTVEMRLDSAGVLHMSGEAPMGWIIEARLAALSQPGVNGVDISGLHDPRNDQLAELVHSVEGATVLFPSGKANPEGAELDKLSATVERLVALDRLARDLGMTVTLTIYGHADAVGSDKRNYEISQERAKTIAAMLYSHGSTMPITLYGMGAEYADQSQGPGQGDEASRRIELHVQLNQAPKADFEILQGLSR